MNNATTTITCHEKEMPAILEHELDALYGNLFSSLTHFRIYGGAENASTYVARKQGKPVAIFLFRIQGNKVQVINEGMVLPAIEVARFADYMFTAFPAVSVVSFHAVHANLASLRLPYQQTNFTEDSVIPLPASAAAYLAMLGSSTRKKVKNYMNRVQRTFPSFQWRVATTCAINDNDVSDIIMLNRRRMFSKNKVSAIGERQAAHMLKLAKSCGFVVACTIEGRICCGMIGYRVGDHYFSFVTAHDPDYDPYRLGLLINFLAISEAIARGGREYHLLWGREPQKALLQGAQRNLDDIHVFRSRLAVARHASLIIETALRGMLRRLKIWAFQEPQPRHTAMARFKADAFNFLRQAKRKMLQRA